jgi:cell division septation protein DedD
MAQTEITEIPRMPTDTDSSLELETTPAVPEEDDNALRKRLLSRIAVAGVVILGLLGGLAVFDVLVKPQTPTPPKMAAAPIEQPTVAEPAGKPEEQSAIEERKEGVADSAAVPERTEDAISSLSAGKPLTLPASPRTASIKPPPPVVVPAKPDLKHEIAKVIPERTAPTAVLAFSAASKPLAPTAQIIEGAKRFLVQVGVFSNHANAEELVTKLQAAGIPAQIESRVQVGPFASRAEADAARAKLKALGIDDGLLVRR